MKIAIKVGGSVFYPTDQPNVQFIKMLAKTLIELRNEHSVVVVVGGGRLARKMIEEARQRTDWEDELHLIGIKASRMNVKMLLAELKGKAYPEIPENVDDVEQAFAPGRIVVVGGFKPGQTTDAVTVQSAEAIDADLIIIGTDVKGVYEKDPKIYPDAVFITEISASKLREMVETEGMEPGKKTIMDPVAAKLIEKTKKRVIVLDIRNLDNMKNAIAGKAFEGTVIV